MPGTANCLTSFTTQPAGRRAASSCGATPFNAINLPPGASMRAPGEAVGMLAIEGAMDELAEKLGLDPVELRLMNDVQFDPEKGPKRPFSSRKLAQALRTGAKAFGWDDRPRTPEERRDGEWFVGYGVASAFRTNLVKPSGATIRLEPGGTVTVETQMTDIGTGSYTILGQVAAEMLGVTLEQVQVRLGDSEYPESSGSGGSWGANSASAGVYAACDALRRDLMEVVQRYFPTTGSNVEIEQRGDTVVLVANIPLSGREK